MVNMDDNLDIPERFLSADVIDVTAGEKKVLKKITKEATEQNTKTPNQNDRVVLHYAGTLTERNEGIEFDSSKKRGQPLVYKTGTGRVIKGWETVVPTMRKGEVAEVLIQSDYAYGPSGPGDIPANAALIFEMELVDFGLDIPEEFQADGIIDVCDNRMVLKRITQEGTGAHNIVSSGHDASLHYTGYLTDGVTKFDSSRDRGEPFDIKVGAGSVIRGWEEVVPSMRLNERCRVLIQPEYAYGAKGSGQSIPPDSALIFDIELLALNGIDISENKDKSFTKMVEIKSESFEKPEVFDTVVVTVTRSGDALPFLDRYRYMLGEEELHECLDLSVSKCLYNMTKGEKSIFNMRGSYPANTSGAPLQYTVELHELYPEPRAWEMTNEQKIEACKKYKDAGTEHLQAGHIKTAKEKYEYILTLTEEDMPKEGKEKDELIALRVSGMLNMSLCNLKLKDYYYVAQCCNDILEIQSDNEKAWYRSGTAYFHLNDHRKAMDAFNHIIKNINPDNKQAIAMLAKTKKQVKVAKEKELKMAQKMFGIK